MTSPRVAYLACSTTLPSSKSRRDDAFEHDLTVGFLGLGLHRQGRTLTAVQWDHSDVDWSSFEAAVIGTTWDYPQRLKEFTATLHDIDSKTTLLNPLELVVWNTRKTYLQALAQLGIATIPTLWLERVTESACREAFATFAATDIVIKPQVGAGAWRQVLLNQHEPWPADLSLPPAEVMVQPLMRRIRIDGEYSFLFFNRRFSNAVVKRAVAGDYRIQSLYGGIESPHLPTSTDLSQAKAVVDAVEGPLLYARVDMVRDESDQLLLMELELIEPYLYPMYAPEMGHHFARAYLELVG